MPNFRFIQDEDLTQDALEFPREEILEAAAIEYNVLSDHGRPVTINNINEA